MRASTALAVRRASRPALPTKALPTASNFRHDWLLEHLAAGLFLLSFRHFHREDLRRTKHVRTKNNPFHVRRESDVWLKSVVVFG